jgi:hypothetical protein
MVTGTRTTVNNGPGEQNDPHVSGDIAVYTDGTVVTGQSIHYFTFSSATDTTIATPAGASDLLSDISNGLIAFTRIASTRNAIFVYDTAHGTLTEVNPTPGSNRIGSAIGGNTVAMWSSTPAATARCSRRHSVLAARYR